MFEVLQNLEDAAARLDRLILLGPGIATLLLGLFVWLGGAGYKKHLLAASGALLGIVCAFLVVGRNVPSALVLGAVLACIAVWFERVFISILAGILAATIAFGLVSRPYMGPVRDAGHPERNGSLDPRSSAALVGSYAIELSSQLHGICRQMPARHLATIAGAAAAGLAAGLLATRLAAAAACAVLGTLLIFGGMVWLLLYKGSAPISTILNRPAYYASVFALMVAFGTLEQLILCKTAKPKPKQTKQTDKNPQQPPSNRSWRTK